jgi:DNA repair protein SbcC/Rad50
MVIRISKLTLINFKGAKLQEIDFNHVTNIYGANGKGKTRVFDAFLWLFFGKDSTDRKDFEIKTLDEFGQAIPKIDHEVSAIIYADDQRIEIKRILREKWEKKRGTNESVFTGNETLYYWNDVPMQQKEYQVKINSLVDENVFKLITNTLYFNSLKWQDRRNELMKIAGTVGNDDVMTSLMTAENKEALTALVKELNNGKTLAEFKTQIAAKKKKIKDDLEAIPTRIDEATRSMPLPANFDSLRERVTMLQSEIAGIDDQIQDAVKQQQAVNDAAMKRSNRIYELKTKLQNLEHAAKNSFQDQRRERETEIANLRRNIQALAKKRFSFERI